MSDYDYIHKATNARLAEMLVEMSTHHVSEKRVVLEEAARRLRIPPHRTFHKEYMGEV